MISVPHRVSVLRRVVGSQEQGGQKQADLSQLLGDATYPAHIILRNFSSRHGYQKCPFFHGSQEATMSAWAPWDPVLLTATPGHWGDHT